jgi:hypothetical protein
MPKLKQATKRDINAVMLPADISHIQKDVVYVLSGEKPVTHDREVDSLIEIETAIKKCKQVGMFS